MKVSDAVVEVAARELARRRGYGPDESWQEFDRSAHLSAEAVGEYFDDPVIVRWQTFSDEARAALEAALPLVLGEPVAWCSRQKNGLAYGSLAWSKQDVLDSPIFDPELDEAIPLCPHPTEASAQRSAAHLPDIVLHDSWEGAATRLSTWAQQRDNKNTLLGQTMQEAAHFIRHFIKASAQREGHGAVFAELERAVAKFPTWPTDPLHAVAVLGEEFGELTKAVLQSVYEPHKVKPGEVRTESVQTAAMALRFLLSLDRYAYTPGEQHEQPMLTAARQKED